MCAERAKSVFRVEVLGTAEGCIRWFNYARTYARTHTRHDYCLLPTLSPHLLNTYQWGFAAVDAGHNYNKWFFFWGCRTMVVRRLKWVENPQESANVLSWIWKGWLTGWPHGHIVSLLSSIFLSLLLSCSHKQISVPACWHQSHKAWLVPGCSPAYWMAWHL